MTTTRATESSGDDVDRHQTPQPSANSDKKGRPMFYEPIYGSNEQALGYLRPGETLGDEIISDGEYTLVYVQPAHGDPRWVTLAREHENGELSLITSIRLAIEYDLQEGVLQPDWDQLAHQLLLGFVEANHFADSADAIDEDGQDESVPERDDHQQEDG